MIGIYSEPFRSIIRVRRLAAMERPTRFRLAAVKRTALPARLSAAYNKVEIKVIAKKMLSNYTFVTSKYNQGAAARRFC